MVFVACGINHKTAPLEVREKIALTFNRQDALLNNLIGLTTVNEAAVLSTCNRTEIYCETTAPESIIPWLAKEHNFDQKMLSSYLYLHHGHQGIRHTLRVASGLDSMMLGEPQIFGQMKQAYHFACQLGTVKTNLRQVFQYVFSASKRVRNGSGIGANPVSVASTAVQLMGQLFPHFHTLRVFIIGSGETATLVAKYLFKQGVRNFFIASRTHSHAQQLAAPFAGEAITIGDIPQFLAKADVVVSATACPLPFINKSLVEHALKQREKAPMFFLDLAVPRDIEANVAELDHVHLYNIDDLQSIIVKGMDKRRTQAVQAEQLIDNELENYLRRHRALRAKDIITEYRSQMQSMAQQELQRAEEKLAAGFSQEKILPEFCARLVNKLAHLPTIGLKQAAEDGREELFDLVHYLFNSPLIQTTYEEIS